MEPDPTTPSGSRWEPGTTATATAAPPPPPPVPDVKPARRLTGPIVAGALGLAVLTGAGGFALGHAVGSSGANDVRPGSGQLQNGDRTPGEGRFPGGRQGRGDGRFGTPPGEQGSQQGQSNGQSNGQGT